MELEKPRDMKTLEGNKEMFALCSYKSNIWDTPMLRAQEKIPVRNQLLVYFIYGEIRRAFLK